MAARRPRLLAGFLDRQALALIALIFLSEAAIAVIFFSIVQQYPAHLLSLHHAYRGHHALLLRRAAVYAGSALSAYGFAKLPGQPVSGWLVDRFGARRMLLLGLAGAVLAALVMARAPNVVLFVATAAAYGVGVAVIWPAVYTLVGDSYSASLRGRLTSLISGAQIAGSALGFAVGALVIDYASFAAAFVLAIALDAGALLLSIGAARRVGGPARGGETPQTGLRERGAALRSLLSLRLLLLYLILALVSVAVTLLVPDLKPFSSVVLHLRYSTFSLLLAFPALVAVLTLLPSGFIVDRAGRTLPMLLAVTLWPLAVLGLSLTGRLPLVIPLACLAALAYALGLPAWNALLIDLTRAGSRGLQIGLASAVQAIGLAIGPAIGGVCVDRLGPRAPFRVSAALMLVAALLTLAQRARTRAVDRATNSERADHG